jgi:hypothetical protein
MTLDGFSASPWARGWGAAEVDVAKDRVGGKMPSGKPRVKRCYWEQPRRVKAADQR